MKLKERKFYPWLVVILLMVVSLLNYLDRQMLSTMRPYMVADFPQLQAAENFGRLMAIFLWIYAFLSPFSGMIADRLNRKWLIVGSLFVWSSNFLQDLAQVDSSNLWSIILGGVIFNASNILLAASTSIAGLAVAFPLGVGISLVLGTVVNYFGAPKGNPVLLFVGVALIMIAIICNGIASGKVDNGSKEGKSNKGIYLAVVAGALMAFFYRFVAKAMDLNNFECPAEGMVTPYSAIVIFSFGVLLSNFLFNTIVMKKPFVGEPVTYKQYLAGKFSTHLVGVLGGSIWCLGTAFSYIASGYAGAAISYALGQGAPMIAAIWGVFIWKEFKGANGKGVYVLLSIMFLLYLCGLAFIIASGN